MTRITIVRHGETEWNKSMQLQGHTDSPLTEIGLKQAEQLAETIKNRDFNLLISSDLNRALQTAKIINRHLMLNIELNKELRERAFGIMEGLTRKEVEIKYKDTFQAYMTRKADFNIRNGESLIVFSNRVINAINEIIKKHHNKNILIVSHGGVLDCIIRYIFKIDLDAERMFTIYNTSVNTITIDNGKWFLEEWGNIEHLKKIKSLNEFN
jgi:probable phosphoglycerate mutase